MTDTKLRILCLHGYRQNGIKLRGRIAALRRTFRSSIDFECIDAPFVVPYIPTTETHVNIISNETEHTENHTKEDDLSTNETQYCWWDYYINEVDNTHTYTGIETALEYLATIWHDKGPFDGIFGFSQGGMMASMILQLQKADPTRYPFAFSFGIFIAAARSKDPKYDYYMESPLLYPSVHIMGEGDNVVDVERSRELSRTFKDPIVYEHSGGHYIPTHKEPKDILRSFIKNMQQRQLK